MRRGELVSIAAGALAWAVVTLDLILCRRRDRIGHD